MSGPAHAHIHLDPAESRGLTCSMCGKGAHELRYLMGSVAGGHICGGCTVSAMKVLARARVAEVLRGVRSRRNANCIPSAGMDTSKRDRSGQGAAADGFPCQFRR